MWEWLSEQRFSLIDIIAIYVVYKSTAAFLDWMFGYGD